MVDMAQEETGIRWGTGLATLVAIAGFAIAFLVLPHLYSFPAALDERLAFGFKASLFVVFTLVTAIGMVSTARRTSPEDIGGAAAGPPSEKLAIKAAFLQNTLEQSVVAIVTIIAFATLVTGSGLALVPATIIMFVIGRVLFYRGYPGGASARAFGMGLTLMPSALLLVFALGAAILEILGLR